VSKIEVQVLKVMFKREPRLMIIQLRKYNEVRELLIENGTTGLQRHICYWDGGWRVSVTTAVHMGKKEMGMKKGHRGTYNQSLSQE